MKPFVVYLVIGCMGLAIVSYNKTERDDPPVTPNDTVFETLSGKVQKRPFITVPYRVKNIAFQ